MQRREALTSSVICLLGLSGLPAAAQGFPVKPVRVIVGFPPGGANDILARLYAAKLQTLLGQNVVIENKPGANSIIAAEFVSKAPADGYTLLVASNGVLTVNPAVYTRLPYDPVGDFEVLGALAVYPSVLITKSGSGLSDLASLKAASARKALNHGVGSSVFQLAGEYFAQQSGLRLVHINYKGNGPVLSGILAGDLDFAIVDVASALAMIQSGQVTALGVTTPHRARVLPNIPTIAELGVPGFDITGWTCLVAPAKTDTAIVERLRSAIRSAAADPETASQLSRLGMEPASLGHAALLARISEERSRWAGLAKTAGIRLD